MTKFVYRNLLAICGMASMVLGHAQTPMDIWLMGYEEYPVPWYGHTRLEISKEGRQISAISAGMNFDQTMAVWQDTSGELRLYTNGCAVATGEGQILTDALNPGTERDILCPDYGYTLEGGALFLDDPAGDGGVILIHQGQREDVKAVHLRDKLYMSRFRLDESGGELTGVNELLVDAPMERFVAVRHGNGRDWWLLCPGLLEEKWYVILLHPEGYTIQIMETGVSSWDMNSCIRGMPSLAASPDGTLISRWNPNCGLRVYAWDRCGGQLEYLFETHAQIHKTLKWSVGSTIFSPSGRYIYANNHVTVYRLDTWAGTTKLDTQFWAMNHWGMPLNQMGIAEDGRIYISQAGSDSCYAMIHLPDAPNLFPVFVPKGLCVGRLFRGTMPVTVNRRLGPMEGSGCDTVMVHVESPQAPLSEEGPSIRLQPNPAREVVRIHAEGSWSPRQYQIVNSAGVILKTGEITANRQLDITGLPPGWYMVMLNPYAADMIGLKLVITD